MQRNIQTEREDNLAAVAVASEDAPSHVCHIVVAFAFVLGLVLFLDRAALSVLAPAVRRDLNIGPMAMGGVFTAFIWGYALLHVPVGWLAQSASWTRLRTAMPRRVGQQRSVSAASPSAAERRVGGGVPGSPTGERRGLGRATIVLLRV